MTGPPVRVSAYYSAPVDRFLTTEPYHVLGALASAHSHDLDVEQRQAWEEELLILKEALTALTGTLFLEFDVPRLGSRIDAVLICGPAVFPIEFKCGESHHRLADYNQAWDYALDLKNFHAGSHEAPIFPILVATRAQAADAAWQPAYPDGVRPPYRCNARHLRRALLHGVAQSSGREIDGDAWGSSPYQPTPSIIEAARELYARHSVEAISRHDAGARNLRLTSVAVEEIIERARAWTTIHKEDRKRYLLNAYRVLLTRARQGMIVFVPPGDPSDPTRAPSFYDDTYQYLIGLGVADV